MRRQIHIIKHTLPLQYGEFLGELLASTFESYFLYARLKSSNQLVNSQKINNASVDYDPAQANDCSWSLVPELRLNMKKILP